jgi:hypothetical protein
MDIAENLGHWNWKSPEESVFQSSDFFDFHPQMWLKNWFFPGEISEIRWKNVLRYPMVSPKCEKRTPSVWPQEVWVVSQVKKRTDQRPATDG